MKLNDTFYLNQYIQSITIFEWNQDFSIIYSY